jgi:hypothetical protein
MTENLRDELHPRAVSQPLQSHVEFEQHSSGGDVAGQALHP